MTLCGIEKYDRLPEKVNWIDVGYLRHLLVEAENNRASIIQRLDNAILENMKKEEK